MAGKKTAESHLRVVNTAVDGELGTFDECLESLVPENMRNEVRVLHEASATQQIHRVRGVPAKGGTKAWFNDWDPADGFYWPRQRKYLIDSVGRSPSAVEATDDDSDRVLSYLEDPRGSGPRAFNTRGLVIGHVQSGKTENFSALIAKAADVGYQVIIVLSGVQNVLRQQTQRRLERELGLQDAHPGVGLPEAGKRWNNPTTADIDGDFDPGTSDSSILQGNEKVIFIVKKWHTVLDKLIEFIEDANPPAHLPVLVIDDEADQASINTGGNREQPLDELVDEDDASVDLEEETNPSETNRLIRKLLAQFQRVAYVGYTATAFANVLIDHDAEDVEVYEDLFPKDFLLTLFPRPGYVGATRLFGRDALEDADDEAVEGLDVIRFIPPSQIGSVTPAGVRVADFTPSVPETLELAFKDWLLATGARMARDGEDQPSTMLIHVHQQTRIQNELAPRIADFVREFRNEWRYDKDGPFRESIVNRWESEFLPVTRRIDPMREVPFDEIEGHIDRLLKDGVPVLALNSRSEDSLDYEENPNLKAVLIGGNRLSRGVTIEGLLVSYYMRPTPYYDTLMQMARWFGYRESYVDLTRLWTTESLASWFRDLALREEELRMQILQAERDELTPVEAGYRIRSHPAMMVTAQNKMGAGRMKMLSYEGRMIQTSRFRLQDVDWLTKNLEAAQDLIGGLGPVGDDSEGIPIWKEVQWERIYEFLGRYSTVQSRTSFDAEAAAKYIERQVEEDELRNWQVAIAGQRSMVDELGGVDLGIQDGGDVNAISRSRLKDDPTSIGVLTSPARPDGPIRQGDEEIGLSKEQILAARQRFADKEFERIRDALLAQRDQDEGLLVLYPISRYSKAEASAAKRLNLFEDPAVGQTVIGVALAFPPSQSAATIEYVMAGSGNEDE